MHKTLSQLAAGVSLMVMSATGGSLRAIALDLPATDPGVTSIAQGTPTFNLYERADLIGACRLSPSALDVFVDAARTRPHPSSPSLAANTRTTLTGIVGTGIGQIQAPVLGWISTSKVEPCTVTPPPPTAKACYRVLTSGLNVRSTPSTAGSVLGSLEANSRVFATSNPPKDQLVDGRNWVEIVFQGKTGWIARAVSGGANAVRLSDSECAQ